MIINKLIRANYKIIFNPCSDAVKSIIESKIRLKEDTKKPESNQNSTTNMPIQNSDPAANETKEESKHDVNADISSNSSDMESKNENEEPKNIKIYDIY